MRNAILIYFINGKAEHRFCSDQEVKIALEEAKTKQEFATVFFLENAEDAYEWNSFVRSQVEGAKEIITNQMNLKIALDREGVPQDPILREAIYKAAREWKSSK